MKRLGRGAALALAWLLSAPVPGAAQAPGFDLTSVQLPEGFLELSDIVVHTYDDGSTTVIATTSLNDQRAYMMMSSVRDSTDRRRMIVAVQPDDWSLTGAFPELDIPALDGVELSNVGLVLSGIEVTVESADLPADDYYFYRSIYGRDDFRLELRPGLNLIGTIPLESLEEGHPLLVVMDALGIERRPLFLQGSIPRSLFGLGGGGGIRRDLFLRAELPPVRPPGSPAWFVGGQLAFELTGSPSAAVAGEMTVDIEDAELTFRLAALLARSGMSLTGGLAADEPWVAPFGIEWMTFNEAVLALGIRPPAGLNLGFAGSMVVGEKDVDVAVQVTINMATGVPTNFIFDGESAEGVALSDLVMLQQRMAQARQAAQEATGAPADTTTRLPIDALPDIAIEEIALAFAPRPAPELGVERGFRIAGQLALPIGPDGEMERFAGVDVGVGEGSVWAEGELGAFTLGPIEWQDALLDLELSLETQHFFVRGEAALFGGASSMLDVGITREALSFETESRLYDLFTATLTAEAAFNLRSPSFEVHGLVENDFGEYLWPLVNESVAQFSEAGTEAMEGVDDGLAEAEELLADQTATVEQLRALLEARRAAARQALETVQQQRASARVATRRAYSRYLRAHRLWRATSWRRPGLRARRQAVRLRALAIYRRSRARYNVASARVGIRRRIFEAIPPVEENVVLLSAEAARELLVQRVETMRSNLQEIEERYTAITDAIAAGGTWFTVERAELRADLEALMDGRAAEWTIEGTFADRPYRVNQSLNFADPNEAVADLISTLVEGR